MSLSDDKSELRAKMRRLRYVFVESLSAPRRELAFARWPAGLADALETAECIALYSANGAEAPTDKLIAGARDMGKRIALPRISPRRDAVEFRLWGGEQLHEGAFDIRQPGPEAETATPDIIVAPLIAFDARMRRLGQGGGYYDRLFAAHPDALRIGLAWSVQESEHVPAAKHDKPMHYVLTERALIAAGGKRE